MTENKEDLDITEKDTCRGRKSTSSADVEKPESEEALGAMIKVTIDDKDIKVPMGTKILEAAEKLGITIPTLCNHDDLCVAGACRICVVEVEDMDTLQTACAFPITSSITVHTHTRKVRRARRHVLDLMLSKHYGECYSCVRNGNCELQDLAEEYGVDYYRFGHIEEREKGSDDSSFSIVRDMDKCIQCRRCVRTCVDLQEVGVYGVLDRGEETHIGTFLDSDMEDIICIYCGQCVNRCPTGALHEKDHSDRVWEAIDASDKHVVLQTAPAPRSGMAECFEGVEAGTPLTFEMNTAVKYCGFDKVFDTNFSADLTIIEEGTELLERLHTELVGEGNTSLPLFTSCSPGWVKYIEHFYPEMLDHVSSAKSPQQMFGSTIKTYYAEQEGIDPADIITVALMPCTAKKFECNRPEMNDSGYKDIDFGLTTRELAQMFKETGIDLPEMEKSDFDSPFGTRTGSGVIFGATGGVMESAIRTLYELVTGHRIDDLFEHANVEPVRGFENIRYAELPIEEVGEVPELLQGVVSDFDWLEGVTLKVAVAHGTANAKKVLENIKKGGKLADCHFIEFMACPGGCLGGGGMPIPTNEEIRKARAQAIYSEDEASEIRKSYENPAVAKLYKDFLTGGPCGEKSHKYLHTHYTFRGNKLV